MLFQRRQQGLTLLELMIALALSVVLIGGIITIYTSSKQTYKSRDQLSLMDENARVALLTLMRGLEHANYKIEANDYFINATPKKILCSNGKYNIAKPNLLKLTQDNSNGDTVGIIFSSDINLPIDCANIWDSDDAIACRTNPVNNSQYVYNSFYVASNGSDNLPNLYCMSSRSNTPVPIVQGVENIQFLYGVNVDNDKNYTVDQYFTASQIETQKLWGKILTIKVGILVRSIEPTLEKATSKTYKVLDASVSFNDRYQRAVYGTTIELRNAIKKTGV